MTTPETTWVPLSATGQEQTIVSAFGFGGFGLGTFDQDVVTVSVDVHTAWTNIIEPDGGFIPYSATGYRTVIGGYGLGRYGKGRYGIGAGQKIIRNPDISTAWSETATK